jgi:hypothetical protein
MSTAQPSGRGGGFSAVVLAMSVLLNLGFGGFMAYRTFSGGTAQEPAAVFEVERLIDEAENKALKAKELAEESLGNARNLRKAYREEVDRKTRQDGWRLRSGGEGSKDSPPPSSSTESK